MTKCFHKNKSGERSMLRQYEVMRKEFLQELVELLADFRIEVKLKGKAA